MTPILGEQDEFEGLYTERFRSLARPYGEFIKYERDRAALDIGLHLTNKTNQRFRTVANTRVWFQLKGIRETTLSLVDFEESLEISLDLRIEDLRFWYASPETVYLAVYVESADTFLAEDVHDVVDRDWGESLFAQGTFGEGQQKTRVRISTASTLDPPTWERMLEHRSMRIDGPAFRGRPLGHRLDPLRSRLAKMDPGLFSKVVEAILDAHGYDVETTLDERLLFPSVSHPDDQATLTLGRLNYTYEWVLQMTTEFGYDERSGFRIEGGPLHAQGRCAVLVHAQKASLPEREALSALLARLSSDGIRQLLVFTNDQGDAGYFGSFFAAGRDYGVECTPQHLGDFAFSLLTATNVYLDYRHAISWDSVQYLQ